MSVLRQLKNYPVNPFSGAVTGNTITDEVHAIPGTSPYYVRLFEVLDASQSITITSFDGGTTFTKVAGSPSSGQYRVDSDNKTGWIEFNSADAGTILKVDYTGLGSPISVEHNHLLQYINAGPFLSKFFTGEAGSSLTTSGDVTWTHTNGVVQKEYENLIVTAGDTIDANAGTQVMLISVRGLLQMGAGATISMAGAAGAAGAAGSGGSGGAGPGGAGGDGGENGSINGSDGGAGAWGAASGGGNAVAGTGGDGGAVPFTLFAKGPGASAAGGTGAGLDGTRGTLIAEDEFYWRNAENLLAYGAGGGGGAGTATEGGGGGGAGGGIIIIVANIIDVTATSVISVAGGAGGDDEGTTCGAGGGGAGGTVLVIGHGFTSQSAANTQTNVLTCAGGSGGTGAQNGGDGAAGYKKAVGLYEYNKF